MNGDPARAALLATLLAGCAGPPTHGPETFDTSREPVCTRGCLGSYSTCISGIGGAAHPRVGWDVLSACQANTQQCLSTCPRSAKGLKFEPV